MSIGTIQVRPRLRRAALAVALALFWCASTGAAPAAPQAAPERLSWYGDPGTPDISGVWLRVDTPSKAGASTASKEGWLPWPPPLTASFETIWQRRLADAAAGKRTDDPVRGCMPPGMPRFISGSVGPMLIIQTPGRVLLYRDSAPVRRVWLTDQARPKSEDIEQFSNGNAVGRYQGKDLVTEVIGIKEQPIDSTGIPHSDALKIVERFHRVDATTLKVDLTLTDPAALNAPLTSSVTYKASTDAHWDPKEFICTPETNYHPDLYVR